MSQSDHPAIEALLRERLSSSYNVLREPAHPGLLTTLDQIKEILGNPFDGDNVDSSKLMSITILANLIQLHYELQSGLRSAAAAEAAELINLALKLSQEVHKFADNL